MGERAREWKWFDSRGTIGVRTPTQSVLCQLLILHSSVLGPLISDRVTGSWASPPAPSAGDPITQGLTGAPSTGTVANIVHRTRERRWNL